MAPQVLDRPSSLSPPLGLALSLLAVCQSVCFSVCLSNTHAHTLSLSFSISLSLSAKMHAIVCVYTCVNMSASSWLRLPETVLGRFLLAWDDEKGLPRNADTCGWTAQATLQLHSGTVQSHA